MRIPRYAPRLDCMIFKYGFERDVRDLTETLDIVSNACQQVRTIKDLCLVLLAAFCLFLLVAACCLLLLLLLVSGCRSPCVRECDSTCTDCSFLPM